MKNEIFDYQFPSMFDILENKGFDDFNSLDDVVKSSVESNWVCNIAVLGLGGSGKSNFVQAYSLYLINRTSYCKHRKFFEIWDYKDFEKKCFDVKSKNLIISKEEAHNDIKSHWDKQYKMMLNCTEDYGFLGHIVFWVTPLKNDLLRILLLCQSVVVCERKRSRGKTIFIAHVYVPYISLKDDKPKFRFVEDLYMPYVGDAYRKKHMHDKTMNFIKRRKEEKNVVYKIHKTKDDVEIRRLGRLLVSGIKGNEWKRINNRLQKLKLKVEGGRVG